MFPDIYRDYSERASWYIDSLADLGGESDAVYEITIPENEYGFAVKTDNCQFTKTDLPTKAAVHLQEHPGMLPITLTAAS